MLRSLGLKSRDVTNIVVGQGLRSAVPGLLAGMFVAAVGMSVVNKVVSDLTKVSTTLFLLCSAF